MSSETKLSMETAAKLPRRGFLKALGIGAGAAATGAVVDTATAPAVANETTDERKKSRYKLTPHVATYYRTNRY